MPRKPARVCNAPGCGRRATAKYCKQCEGKDAERDRERGTSTERGYDARWQRARKAFLMGNPLCSHCKAEGRVEAATVVDHIQPHRGDDALFWDRANWQPLCKAHHDTKTATEDGGFGNRRRDNGE